MITQRSGSGSGWPAHRVLRLAALVLGAADVLFLSAFALDAFTPGAPLTDQLIGFGMHLLPSLVLAVLIAIAWWFPIAGGLALAAVSGLPFIALANPIPVNLMLSLPVLLTGCLFLSAAWSSSQAGGGS